MDNQFDLDNLRHPEDIAQEVSETELVGYYMRVYMAYVRLSWNNTQILTKHHDMKAAKFMGEKEGKIETWLAQADEYMPEWFNRDLLGYPEDTAFGDNI